MSEKCQQRKWKTQFDQRPNSSAVHRDESCLEPRLGLACWLSRALPRRYGEIGRSAFLAFLQHELGHGIAGKVVKDGAIGALCRRKIASLDLLRGMVSHCAELFVRIADSK